MSDVIVVGGGVIGCAIARALVRRGVTATVVERATPGRGATWAAAGMISPLAEPGPFRDLALASFLRYPAFIEELVEASRIDFDFAITGKLHIALRESALQELDALAHEGAPFGAQRLDARAVLEMEPAVDPAVAGGVYVRDDGRVDNRRLGEALADAARREGVRFVAGSVRALHRDGRPARAAGVRLDDGRLLAGGAIVLAAGAWSGAVEGVPGSVPVRPVRGQMLALSMPAGVAGIDRMIESPGCYLVPRKDGRILVGATVEEAGFDPGPTLAGVAALAEAAVDAVPALADRPLLETWAGYRPGTPDALPILGEDPDLPGLVHATGHFRNGILLAPITADVIADVLTGVAPAADIRAFGVGRFRDARRDTDAPGAARPRETAPATGFLPAPSVSAQHAEARTRSEAGPAASQPTLCDMCGRPMIDRHCKLVCPDCGYMRDCSDP
jgi:glycine oxidase